MSKELPLIHVQQEGFGAPVVLQTRGILGLGKPIFLRAGNELPEDTPQHNFELIVKRLLPWGNGFRAYEICSSELAERRIRYPYAAAISTVLERPVLKEVPVREVRLIVDR